MASPRPILDYARNSRRALKEPPAQTPSHGARPPQRFRRVLYTVMLAAPFCAPLAIATALAWEFGNRNDALLFTAGLIAVAFICVAVANRLPIDENDIER
jgi:hypothetical protein